MEKKITDLKEIGKIFIKGANHTLSRRYHKSWSGKIVDISYYIEFCKHLISVPSGTKMEAVQEIVLREYEAMIH